MKMNKRIFATLAAVFLSMTVAPEAHAANDVKIGVINFKQCVERSKVGQQEQSSFEALKTQAEQVLQDKEKQMSQIAGKLDDPDYLDSLSPEAEAELKHKFRSLNQELTQQQQQLYQTLSQANFKVVQKLTDIVNEAAQEVAANLKLDLIINEDACFFFADTLDITNDAVKVIDKPSK
jgi:outer membrane protein